MCPECWEVNSDGSACIFIENSGCCEFSCDDAKVTFNFEPKMFGLSDASQVNKFGSLGPNGNEDSGLYEYSRGMGADGQKITIDDSEMIFSVKVELESTDERFQDPSSKFILLIIGRPRKIQ